MLLDQLECFVHGGKHAQGEEIDLDHARVVHRVLVPLHEHPAFHRRLLQWHQLNQRPRRDDHAADMLRNVTWEASNLLGQVREMSPERSVQPLPIVLQTPHLRPEVLRGAALAHLRQPVQLCGRQAERLPHLTYRTPNPVSGERRHETDVIVPEVLVSPQNQLLADVPREIEVDVRNRSHFLVQEPAQEKIVRDRVDMRQPNQVANNGADRRAAAAPRRPVARAPSYLFGDGVR